jgi:AcrR family transcriptional regulator
VIEEAGRMADEAGLPQITLAALASRLGVRQPSLYKHVDGIGGLQRGIAIQSKHELAAALSRAAIGRSRGEAIMSMAHAYRAWALEHPGRYAALQHAPAAGDTDDEAASNAMVQIILDVLTGFGLRDDDAVDAARALRSALHGFVTLESGGGFGLPADIDRSYDRLVRGLVGAFSRSASEPVVTPSPA